MLNEKGRIDPLVIPLVVSIFLVVGLAGFGLWSYVNYTDARDNVDEKIAVAVSEAETAKAEELEVEFSEREKSPFQTYVSASSLGSISITYPRNWSVYVDDPGSGSVPLDVIFHPGFVPEDDAVAYALQVNVLEKDYDKAVSALSKDAEDGDVAARPITISDVTGIRFDGQIDRKYRGAVVFLPLRDKTIQIWTESENFVKDFNDVVVKNLSFEP